MARMKPVYVFSGFIDAGKTTAIKESLLDPQFNEGETTLLVVFEQGDEEYDEDFLYESNSYVEYLDDVKDLTPEKVSQFDDEYDPDRIIIELNGMQNDQELNLEYGGCPWIVVDYLTFFDATQLKFQMLNMRQFVFNHIINASICYINRCDGQDYMYFRNNLKGINRYLQIVFLDAETNMPIRIEAQMFDTSKPLDISDDDYGLWYIDAIDNADKYDGCHIRLKMKLLTPVKEYENVAIMGREAMVCCSNDMQAIGITCTNVDPDSLEKDAFYNVGGTLKAMDDEEGNRTVILETDFIEKGETPEDPYVNFN